MIYVTVGTVFDLCIVSIPFFICTLVQSNALTIVSSFGSIGLIVALSQMPWSYIAESMASRQSGLGEVLFLTAFVAAAVILYIVSAVIFCRQDIQ